MFRILAALVALVLSVASSGADDIAQDCGTFNDVGLIPQPVSQNTLEIMHPSLDNRVALLALSYVGEPVSAGAWLLLFVDQGEPTTACYLIHKGIDDDLTGFNDVYVSSSVLRFNSMTGGYEVFVPVSEYPFVEDEDHQVRMIEINLDEKGIPSLVASD